MTQLIEQPPLTADRIQAEIRLIEEATGLSRGDFIEAYRRGELIETPENMRLASLISACRLTEGIVGG